jgi:hypothetical protein
MENMSLIHHIAHDGNLDCLKELSTLPYFKEIVNDDNNEVLLSIIYFSIYLVILYRFIGRSVTGALGLFEIKYGDGQISGGTWSRHFETEEKRWTHHFTFSCK